MTEETVALLADAIRRGDRPSLTWYYDWDGERWTSTGSAFIVRQSDRQVRYLDSSGSLEVELDLDVDFIQNTPWDLLRQIDERVSQAEEWDQNVQ